MAEPNAPLNVSKPPTELTGRVLLVDDERICQQIHRHMLSHLGLEVDIAGDGWQAVAARRLRSYDAVLMDGQMPNMDGQAAAAAIRRFERIHSLKPVPIIALMAETPDEQRARCLEAGMNDYLSKPVDPKVLAETLGWWLEPSGDTAQSAS